MTAIEEAIDDLYSAFQSVPKPQKIDGCECCTSEEDLKSLLSHDLKQIPAEVMTHYAASALLTVGSVDDYLYFLPRILHIHVLDNAFWPDVAVTGRAIGSTGLWEWPAERRDALTSFLSNLIRSFLEPEKLHLIDDWMCAIGKTGLSVETYLSDIQGSKEAVLYYFDQNLKDLPAGKLSNPFWDPPKQSHDKIVDWFYSATVRSIFLEAYGYVLPERDLK